MSTPSQSPPSFSGDTQMGELLQLYPGARRALFAKYHIGGCSSCGFSNDETLASVCERNENIPVTEVIEHIQVSFEHDERMQISPQDLAALLANTEGPALLDVRSREEHEAVSIPGSRLMTQDVVQEIFNSWSKEKPIILYDHSGQGAMDAAAYFLGHGFVETKCLKGGIDAYSLEVDQSLPRYQVEFTD